MGQSIRDVDAADPAAVVAWVEERSATLLMRGDVETLRDAAAALAPGGGPLPAALAWRWAYVLHQTGHFAEAAAVCDRVDVVAAAPPDAARLDACRAAAAWAQGDVGAGRSAADRALATARECGDDGALALAWVSQALVSAAEGDRHANATCYERALAAAARVGDVLTQVRVRNNLGSLENEEGRYTAALAHLDEAISLCVPDVAPSVRALASINRAEALLGLGRVDEAVAELRHAITLTRAADSPMLGFAVLGLADADRVRGNATQAAAAYREAIELAERTHDAQILVPAIAGLARCLVVDDLDEARGLVKRALDQPAALGQVEPLLAAGWIGLATGDPDDLDDAGELSRRVVREAGRRHDSRGLAEALELQALLTTGARSGDLLDEAATLWTATANAVGLATNQVLRARAAGDPVAEQAARRRLRELGVRDDASRIAGPLQALGRSAEAQVSIRALGAFAVLCDGQPVSPSAWQSRKSRDALKIMAGRRGRAITREALAEHLWPDSGSAAGNRLSVVLSTLRGVLDPGKQHASDRFLVADRESVRLNPETVELDTLLFTRTAQAALRAVRNGEPGAVEELERAAAMYTGHYLEDDPYSDWTLDVRDELLALALDVKRELAAALVAADQHTRAIPWLVGLVGDDPYDEPAHRELVAALARVRRHGEAQRAYRAYCARMAELDTPADPFEALTGR